MMLCGRPFDGVGESVGEPAFQFVFEDSGYLIELLFLTTTSVFGFAQVDDFQCFVFRR
jgi:hypothetical protein